VLERGEVANSWRRERWDSLRLLTPNWQSRLPGLRYEGPDPDGYMTAGEVTEFIERFAAASRVPVRTGTDVTSVRRTGDGYHVRTNRGEIRCRAAVIASGACNRPSVPGFSKAVPACVDLGSGEIRAIIWATGFRPEYGWLDVPVVDAKGQLRHDGGVVDSPGLYALGLPVLRRRKSTYIYGIEDDAREVIEHLARYLAVRV
jgi:glycine/D-amino acid oxidase-like deaminating enzyme